MLINPKKPWDAIPSSEITPEDVYLNRREFLGAAVGAAGLATIRPETVAAAMRRRMGIQEPEVPQDVSMGEELRGDATAWEHVSTYNNFYEFGTDKRDPARNAGSFQPAPWSVRIDGECDNPGDYALEDLIRPSEVEDRIYRFRCVEAWSMVVPWRGIPLRNVISRAAPNNNARYVRFETVFRPEEMPGQNAPILPWPYVEGLRLDEATNILAMLVTGVYGQDLPNQNGAPLRLIVPWKYGFKSIKSIVKISFVEEMPLNTWQEMQSNEYGFFANVNPEVDHPRWSQARERPLPGLSRNRRTELFNGYADQVGHMYRGMDLTRWY
jgi:sulfoxide reductase catalytic subunit YedY